MNPIYLYGFVPADARLPRGGLRGVGRGSVELAGADDLSFLAVVSSVDRGEFMGRGLERNCADMAWISELGLHHEEAIRWFVEHTTILPSRLLNVFSTRRTLLESAAHDADRIGRELNRFRGLREWDLTVGYDMAELDENLAEISEEVAAVERAIAAAKPGDRFPLHKRRSSVARNEGRAAAHRLARDLMAGIEAVAESVRPLTPPAGVPVLASTALLVARGTEPTLRTRVVAARERARLLGLTVELDGPSAPYRFLEAPGA